jgi:hypothetical protein
VGGISSFDAIIAVVLAASAAEAFINEVQTTLLLKTDSLSPRLRTLADVLSEVEAGRGSVLLKYLLAGHVLDKPYDRGANPFQDFATLVTLRNDAMHVKQRDRFDHSDGAFDVVWPPYVKGLQQRGLVVMPRGLGPSFDAVQTPQIAKWACEVAASIVESILELFPADEEIPSRDPIHVIKLVWRNK